VISSPVIIPVITASVVSFVWTVVPPFISAVVAVIVVSSSVVIMTASRAASTARTMAFTSGGEGCIHIIGTVDSLC